MNEERTIGQTELEELERRAQAGEALAQYRLGGLYYAGEVVERDEERASDLRRSAVEQGDPALISYIKQAAEGEDLEAMHSLAMMYSRGLGVPPDAKQAFALWKRAAENGLPQSIYNLAGAYERGTGVKPDLAEAIALYRTALEYGVGLAAVQLGFLYLGAGGVRPDLHLAGHYFRTAMKLGYSRAVEGLEFIRKHSLKTAVSTPEHSNLSMSDKAKRQGPELPFSDPWFKNQVRFASFPKSAVFVCTYELNLGVDCICEALFLNRHNGLDELWAFAGTTLPSTYHPEQEAPTVYGAVSEADLGAGCVLVLGSKGSTQEAAEALFGRLVFARFGFSWPEEILSAGLLGKAVYKEVLDSIEARVKANSEHAQALESEIVKVARELGYEPTPTGTNPVMLAITCPGGGAHHAYINAEENSFACGYCKRSGGPGELRSFVGERRKPRGSGGDK